MTAINKKINKLLTKTYEKIIDLITTDLSKNFDLDKNELLKLLEDTEEKTDD